MEPENDNESNNFSEDSCGGITMILIGIERLSMEKKITEDTKLYDQNLPNLRRKRDECEKDQIKNDTFKILKQYTLDKFFPIK